jgi:hypothetical protein
MSEDPSELGRGGQKKIRTTISGYSSTAVNGIILERRAVSLVGLSPRPCTIRKLHCALSPKQRRSASPRRTCVHLSAQRDVLGSLRQGLTPMSHSARCRPARRLASRASTTARGTKSRSLRRYARDDRRSYKNPRKKESPNTVGHREG